MTRLCFVSLALVCSAPALLAAEVHCPSVLAIKEVAQVPAGWSVFDGAADGEHKFDFAGFSDGPPQLRALLLNSKEADLKQGRVLTYDFDSSQQPWLICSYTETSLTLSQKLPAATKRCQVTLDKKTNFKTAKTIVCF